MTQTVTKIIETETGHRLTDYSGKCNTIHGHRLRWEVTVTSKDLDHVGFVIDYGDLKKVLMKVIDPLDHAFAMHDKDPLVLELGEDNARDMLKATDGSAPRLFIVPFNPTSENILNWIASELVKELPEHITLTKIKLWETSNSYAIWESNT